MARRRWLSRRILTRVAASLISGVLLITLYRSIDIRLIGAELLGADPVWLVLSIGAILPITVVRAIRFFLVAPVGALPGVGEALRLTLVASAANLVIPAKAGDLIKSYFVATRSDTSSGVAVAIVVYERLCDLVAVIAWCLAGWAIGGPQVPGLSTPFWAFLGVIGAVCAALISSERAAALLPAALAWLHSGERFRRLRDLENGWPGLLRLVRGRRRRIIPLSLLLWLAHLFQIWLFTIALGVPIPFTVCASLSALALMAGLVPITVAGIGTRDVALVVLMAGYMPRESAAAMGILMTTRAFIPALLGISFLWPYISSVTRGAELNRG